MPQNINNPKPADTVNFFMLLLLIDLNKFYKYMVYCGAILLKKSDKRKSAARMKNKILAIKAIPFSPTPKPSTAAIKVVIKKNTDQRIIQYLLKFELLFL